MSLLLRAFLWDFWFSKKQLWNKKKMLIYYRKIASSFSDFWFIRLKKLLDAWKKRKLKLSLNHNLRILAVISLFFIFFSLFIYSKLHLLKSYCQVCSKEDIQQSRRRLILFFMFKSRSREAIVRQIQATKEEQRSNTAIFGLFRNWRRNFLRWSIYRSCFFG